MLNLEMIKDAINNTNYAEYIADYDTGYICDVITEIADNNTSIYYSDQANYLKEHIDEVNDIINEFGWDGVGCDLYKAAAVAEFRTIEEELYNILDEMIAFKGLLIYNELADTNYSLDDVPTDIIERIITAVENLDNNDEIEDITSAIDEEFELMGEAYKELKNN